MTQRSSPTGATGANSDAVAGLVGEFLQEQAKERDSLVQQERRRGSSRNFWRLVLVAGCIAAWLVPIPYKETDPLADAAATGRATRAGLELVAAQVTDYVRTHGTLPSSLARVGIRDSFDFIPGPAGAFALRTQVGGRTYAKDFQPPPPGATSPAPNGNGR